MCKLVNQAEALLRFHPASFSSAKSKWVSMSEPSKKSIGKLRMALYGLVNLPTSIVGLPIALYIPAFYSQSLGLSLAAVGALIALSRLSDVVTDPLIGVASDRLSSSVTLLSQRLPVS